MAAVEEAVAQSSTARQRASGMAGGRWVRPGLVEPQAKPAALDVDPLQEMGRLHV